MKRVWLPLAFFLVLLPFMHRPWFFDDPSFLIAGQAAAQHPLHPHSYNLDLGGAEAPVWVIGHIPATTNPPLDAWVLGGIIRFFGAGETALHLVMFGISALTLAGVQLIAPFFIRRPATAAVLWAASPVFFLSALTLYPHLFYIFFYCGTLYSGLRMCESKSWRWGMAFGLCLALAALSLYQWPVLLLLVLLFFWHQDIFKHKGATVACGGLIVFALIWGGWGVWEMRSYGMLHMWASYHARILGSYSWRSAFLPLVFFGGAYLPVLIAWPVIARFLPKIAGALMILGMAVALLFSSPWGGYAWYQACLFAIFFTGALAFLVYAIWLFRTGNSHDRVLVVWFLIEFLFVEKYLGYAGAHSLLPLCLPATFLAARAWDEVTFSDRWIQTSVLIMAGLTVVLAFADQSEAEIGPKLAEQARPFMTTGRIYYWGNSFSGLSYYLQQSGAHSWGPDVQLQPEDRLLVPRNLNTQGPPIALRALHLHVERVVSFTQKNPFRTLSIGDAAGWYSASWGPLPYTFSREPVEQCIVLRK